ncbi:hypothetical protein [Aneurinibacillus terranovensis]|uniref:hypothetical protein n=1 Tax=Aneurinibacillus terranovensis TaxID=278991 RepID=UPI0004054671
MNAALLKKIDKKKKELDQKRPFSTHMVKTLREHLIVEWTYHSNAIEENTLTLSETKVVLEGITVGGVNGHRKIITYGQEKSPQFASLLPFRR